MRKFVLVLLTVVLTFTNTLTSFADTSEENMIAVEFEEIPATVRIIKETHMIGCRCVPLMNISVEEVEAGALKDGMELSISVEAMKFDDYYIKYADGDLDFDDKIKDGRIILEINNASTKKSALALADAEIYILSTIAAGEYDITLTLTDSESGMIIEEKTAEKCLALYNYPSKERQVTPISVKSGESCIRTEEQIIELSSPIYISENGVLMAPLEGMAKSVFANTVMEEGQNSASVIFGQRVARFEADTYMVQINGYDIAMNNKVKMADDILFAPVRDFYGLVVGVSEIVWNDTDKTAEIKVIKK